MSDISELTITKIEEGIEIIKEIAKEVLTRGAWTTIMYHYQDWDPKKNTYSPLRVSIRRYRKIRGLYKQQSKFNISNKEQAEKIIAVLNKWYEL